MWFVIALCVGAVFAEQGAIMRSLSPEQVRTAIAFGIKEKQLIAYKIQEKTRFSWPLIIAYYTTPFLRVALAANQASRRYKEFSEKEVTAEMLAPEIQVYASSQQSRGATIANVQSIVIMPRDGKDRSKAVQPLRTSEASQAYKNLFGFSGEGLGLIAVFPIDAWTEDREIHVVFDNPIPGSHGWEAWGDCVDCKARISRQNSLKGCHIDTEWTGPLFIQARHFALTEIALKISLARRTDTPDCRAELERVGVVSGCGNSLAALGLLCYTEFGGLLK